MLHAIRSAIDSLGERPRRLGIDLSRSVVLDHSEGHTEGVLQLIFSRDSDLPVWVAKAAPRDRVRIRGGVPIYRVEYLTLEALEASGFSRDRRRAPEPLGIWDDDGVLVTLQSALPGVLVKNLPGREVFSTERARARIGAVVSWWNRLQECAGVRRVTIDGPAWERLVRLPLVRFSERFRTDDAERAFLAERLLERRALLGREIPLMVRHGDFCTANMTLADERVAVFDWEFPLAHALPFFDLFHFFASLRYPFSGPRGESGHFESFREVFWGRNEMNTILRETLAHACRAHGLAPELLPDLFLLTLVEVANLKYEGLVERYGDDVASAPRDGGGWERAGGRDKDAPASAISGGTFRNTRFVSQNGLPTLVPDA